MKLEMLWKTRSEWKTRAQQGLEQMAKKGAWEHGWGQLNLQLIRKILLILLCRRLKVFSVPWYILSAVSLCMCVCVWVSPASLQLFTKLKGATFSPGFPWFSTFFSVVLRFRLGQVFIFGGKKVRWSLSFLALTIHTHTHTLRRRHIGLLFKGI